MSISAYGPHDIWAMAFPAYIHDASLRRAAKIYNVDVMMLCIITLILPSAECRMNAI